jgi:hypothetical protein
MEKEQTQQIMEMLAEMKADREQMLARMKAKMDANQAKAAKQEEMLARLDANRAEMRSILCTFRSVMKETIQRQMRAAIQSVRSELDEKRLRLGPFQE